MKLYKKYTKEPYSFSVSDTTLSSDNPLQFRKKLVFVRKLKQSITKLSKTKLNKIQIDKFYFTIRKSQ